MSQYQAVKGTKDVFPDEAVQWQLVEGVVRRLAGLYAFGEVRTPVFEYTELFQRRTAVKRDESPPPSNT